ncbi:hypothetical protein [Bacillus sp. EE-W1]|uniref:hypothetical protein n=1 Tax=Bacillus sp. EE-W1 TaxID=2662453 RepID=UPI0012FCBB11|nr:hypothetical protein [Bacillus sp. EE-W1]
MKDIIEMIERQIAYMFIVSHTKEEIQAEIDRGNKHVEWALGEMNKCQNGLTKGSDAK